MGGESAATLVSQPPRWSRGDSNPGPPPCKGGALPAKLRPPVPTPAAPPARIDTAIPARVGAPGLEPGTSALSGPRSNRLSYAPAGAAVSHSSTAAGPPQDSPGSTPALCPRRSARILPRIDPSTPRRLRSNQHTHRFASHPRGVSDLPAIRGAPARSSNRLATGRPRGSVPTDAGSSPGNLTRSEASKRPYSLERR